MYHTNEKQNSKIVSLQNIINAHVNLKNLKINDFYLLSLAEIIFLCNRAKARIYPVITSLIEHELYYQFYKNIQTNASFI